MLLTPSVKARLALYGDKSLPALLAFLPEAEDDGMFAKLLLDCVPRRTGARLRLGAVMRFHM